MASYILVIEAVVPREVQVGARGAVRLDAGWHLYVGSARRGLAARLARHRRRAKRCRWHVDYLLLHPGFTLRSVWLAANIPECELSRLLSRLPGMAVSAPRFGSSDCRCPSHLWHYPGDLSTVTAFFHSLGLSEQILPSSDSGTSNQEL